MTILEKTPVTISQVKETLKDLEEKPQLKEYLKRFTVLKKEKIDSLIKELRTLNNLKLKEENFIKIADFVPKEQEELNKILTEVSLSEEETNAILEITRKY